jgi:hypothetical protein
MYTCYGCFLVGGRCLPFRALLSSLPVIKFHLWETMTKTCVAHVVIMLLPLTLFQTVWYCLMLGIKIWLPPFACFLLIWSNWFFIDYVGTGRLCWFFRHFGVATCSSGCTLWVILKKLINLVEMAHQIMVFGLVHQLSKSTPWNKTWPMMKSFSFTKLF